MRIKPDEIIKEYQVELESLGYNVGDVNSIDISDDMRFIYNMSTNALLLLKIVLENRRLLLEIKNKRK